MQGLFIFCLCVEAALEMLRKAVGFHLSVHDATVFMSQSHGSVLILWRHLVADFVQGPDVLVCCFCGFLQVLLESLLAELFADCWGLLLKFPEDLVVFPHPEDIVERHECSHHTFLSQEVAIAAQRLIRCHWAAFSLSAGRWP